MHHLPGDVIEHDSVAVAPLALVMGLEVRVVVAPKAPCGRAVQLFEEGRRDLEGAGIETPVDEVEGLEVVDEFNLGPAISLELALRRAFGLDYGKLVALDDVRVVNRPDTGGGPGSYPWESK